MIYIYIVYDIYIYAHPLQQIHVWKIHHLGPITGKSLSPVRKGRSKEKLLEQAMWAFDQSPVGCNPSFPFGTVDTLW